MNFPIIQQHQDLQQAVSARELHDFLEMTERFSSWFDRMLAYGFSESSDFEKCKTFNASNRELEDYFISIDMAKEISMIQRSDKGKQARQYFLECERKLKGQIVTPAIPQSFAEALQLAADQAKQLELAAPKIAHYDKVVERDTLLNATTVAQSVGIKSANALNKILEAMRVYNMACKRGRAFQAWFVDKGYGEMKQGDTGHHQALFTTKGQAWIVEKLGGVK